jgi:acyl-coenzyme A thioesterase PaaI-like protein
MSDHAFQDYYPDDLGYCYGCGRFNEHGYQLKSRWDGDESVAEFTPEPHHISFPGFVYGGLIASLIDCHGTGTAAAAAYRRENRSMDTEPPLRFVTAALHVDYLTPTPMGEALMLRGVVEEIKERKVIVSITVSTAGTLCARGRVVAVRIPGTMVDLTAKTTGG